MKSLSVIVTLATLAAKVSAHYVWPQLIVGGTNTSAWQYVRQTNNWQDLNPLTDVTSTDVRCYDSAQSGTASTTTVAAGSTVGFTVSGNPSNLYHPGVVNVYMAKAPAGTDVASWDGSGTVGSRFTKFLQSQTVARPSLSLLLVSLAQVTFTIPSATPSGQYLIRTEHIALHSASYYGGAQFYIACAQVTVTNGGTGTPGPLVAFPGAYTEPGILINMYYPIPTTTSDYDGVDGEKYHDGVDGKTTSTTGTTTTTSSSGEAQPAQFRNLASVVDKPIPRRPIHLQSHQPILFPMSLKRGHTVRVGGGSPISIPRTIFTEALWRMRGRGHY
ncbi:glycosyl hydrolase family 61-domain-containing protein [Mycena leptocephala]|nr:glycosyl hydrolase family 61-domain-containing protein [Mycena leptocephala]